MSYQKKSAVFFAAILQILSCSFVVDEAAAQIDTGTPQTEDMIQAVRPLLKQITPHKVSPDADGSGIILGIYANQGDLQSYVLHQDGENFELHGPFEFLPVFYGDSLEFMYFHSEEKATLTIGDEARLKCGYDTLTELASLRRIFLTADIDEARARANQTSRQQNFEGELRSGPGENRGYWSHDCKLYLSNLSANILDLNSRYEGFTGGANVFHEQFEYCLALGDVLSDSISMCHEYYDPALLSLQKPRALTLNDFVDSTRLQSIEAELVADLTQRRQAGIAVEGVFGVGRLALAFDASMYPAEESARVLKCIDFCTEPVQIHGCRTQRWLGRTYALAQTNCESNYACNGGNAFIFESLVGTIGEQSAAENMPLDPGSLLGAGVDDVVLSPDHRLVVFKHTDGFVALDVASGRLLWRKAFKHMPVMAEGVRGNNMKRLLSVLAGD